MALGRQIACCLGLLAVAILLLGCGSDEPANAEIDPLIAQEFTDKLTLIGDYADDGRCDRAEGALATLKVAVDDRAPETGEQFTADLQEMLDRLAAQIDEQCEPPETTTESTTTDSSDTEPTITDEPTTTTDESTTTTTTTTTSTTKDTTTTTTPPPTTPGGGGNPPGGGITPGGNRGNGR